MDRSFLWFAAIVTMTVALCIVPASAQITAGTALSFNGSNQYIQVQGSYRLGPSYTVEGWVYLNSLRSPSMWLDFCPEITRFPNADVVFISFSGGLINWAAFDKNTNGPLITSNSTVPLHQWFRLCCTYDSTTGVGTMYVNGAPVGSGSMNPPDTCNFAYCVIGRDNWNWGTSYANAIYDEITIWNTARTAGEVQTDLTHPFIGNEPGMIGYWQFNEGTGSVTNDKVNHSVTGQLMDGPTWVASGAQFHGSNFLAPATLNLGSVNLGHTGFTTITVGNAGDTALAITAVQLGNPAFTVNPTSATIPPQGAARFTITFTPMSIGAISDTLRFTDNAYPSHQEIPVVAAGVVTSLVVSPDTLAFGPVVIGLSKTDTFTVFNNGTTVMDIPRITHFSSRYAIAPAFASIQPGNSQQFRVTYTPATAGSDSDQFTVAESDSGFAQFVAVSGSGIQSGFSISPLSLAFGSVNVGSSKTGTIVVSNSGISPFHLLSATSDEQDYSITPTTAAVPAGGADTFYVTFTPSSSGQIPCNIIFTHDAGGPPVIVAAIGTGMTNPVNSVLAFSGGNVACSAPLIPAGGSFTFEFWAKRNTVNAEQVVLSQGRISSPNNARFVVEFPASGVFTFGFGGDDLTIPDSVWHPDTAWHHWAGSYDAGTGVRIIFRDGNELGRDVSREGFAGNTDPFLIGAMEGSGATFAGMLDEAHLWNDARTRTQIQSDAYATLDHSAASAIAAWSFNEGAGTTVYDISGHHHPGILSGAVAFAIPRVSPPLLTTATDGLSESYSKINWRHIPAYNLWYRIYRTDPVSNSVVLLTTVPSDDSVYFDSTGVRGKVYTYAVAMINGNGQEISRSADQGGTIVFPPSSLIASNALYPDRVQLTWSSPSKVTKTFEIFRNDTLLGTASAGNLSFKDTRATAGVTYTYRLDAVDSNDVRSQSVTATGSRGFTAPVSGLSASYGLFLHKVKIQWTIPAATVKWFRIYRDGVLFDSVASPKSSYVDRLAGSLPEKHAYCVSAVDQFGRESITMCAVGGINILPAPAGVLASDYAYDNRVDISWTDTTTLADSIKIFRDGLLRATVPAARTLFSDYDTIGGISHTYWVRSFADSGGMSFDTLTRDQGTQAIILPPTGLTATNGTYEDKVVLNWNSSSTKTNMFQIYRDGTLIATKASTARTYYDLDCAAGTLHLYSIAGMTLNGVVSANDTASGRRVLLPPSGISATDASYENYTAITWTNNSVVAKGVRIRRSLNDGSQMVVLAPSLPPARTAYNDSTGQSGIIYQYYVDAVDTVGGASYSMALIDRGSRQLLAPLNVKATNGVYEDKVVIAWRDTSQVEAGYHVYCNSVLIGTLAPNMNSFTDANPFPHGTPLAYSVAAFNRYGESALISAAGSAAIFTPISFNASQIYPDHIVLTWTNASAIRGHYFEIERSRNDSEVVSWPVSGDNANCTDIGVVPGVQYSYCIRTAVVEHGDTVLSAPVCCNGVQPIISQPGVTTAVGLNNPLSSAMTMQRDRWGSALAIHGANAIVGSPGQGHEGIDLLYYQNNQWNVSSSNVHSIPFSVDAVAITDKYALVGASQWGLTSSNFEIDMYLKNVSQNTWSLDKTLTGSYSLLYTSVAISDSQFFVGAQNGPTGLFDSVRCYTRGLASPEEIHVPAASQGVTALAANDSVLVAGSGLIYVNGAIHRTGTATLFRKTIDSVHNIARWGSLAPVTITRGSGMPDSVNNAFASAVAISNNTLVVGSPAENAVFVYTLSPNFGSDSTIIACRKVTPSDSLSAGYRFGSSIALDGNNLIVGDQDGAVYQFVHSGMGWVEVKKFGPVDQTKSSGFGTAVGISGSLGLIGSPNSLINGGAAAGAVYPFYIVGTPRSAEASDGQYEDRVHISWSVDIANPTGYRIYRDGELIKTVDVQTQVYDDYDALPGQPYLYGVTAYTDLGETPPATDYGWRAADGSISGHVANKMGGGVDSIHVDLDPSPNRSLAFDGVQGSIHIQPDIAGIATVGSSCTIEAWIKATSTYDGGIVGWGAASLDLACQLRLSNGSPQFDWGGGDILVVNAAGNLTGSWHHVAATYDSVAKTRNIFIDGILAATGTVTNPNMASNGTIAIGVDNIGHHFEGQIDEVRIWNVSRTQAQIRQFMDKPLTGTEAGLSGYWTFDQSSGSVVADITRKNPYGTISGGTYWTSDHAPLNTFALTDAQGNFTITNIPYGQTTTYKVIPSFGDHQFSPAVQSITLSRQSTVQNQVTFTDMTAYNIAGHVRFDACPAANVNIYLNGNQVGTTDNSGEFKLSENPGTYIIQPKLGDHVFTPPFRSVTVTGDTAGLDFQDVKMRALTGRAAGGCDRSIGVVRLEFATPSYCFAETVAVDGSKDIHYAINLPAQVYNTRVVSVDPPPGLDRIAVRNFFTNLGTRQIDLTTLSPGKNDTTLDFIYHAPVTMQIAGLGTAGACSVPILPQGAHCSVSILVSENYGGGQTCPVDTGTLTVYDGINDLENTPFTVPIHNGIAQCTTVAKTPNIDSGILDENGVDRSYQKPFTVYANIPGLQTTKAVQWVIVTGAKPRAGAQFITGTSTPIPMYVLHDPPGDGSSTSILRGTSVNQLIHYESYHLKAGAGLDFEFSPIVNMKYDVGLGVYVQITSTYLSFTIGGSLQAGNEKDWTSTSSWTATTNEQISTGSDPSSVGADADVFVGAGENFTFTQGDNIDVINGTCQVRKTPIIVFNQNGFSTSFYYTRAHIRDVLIPSLWQLYNSAPQGTDTTKIRDYILAWSGMLAWDDSIKRAATLDAAQGNKSFSAGAGYTYSYQTDTTSHYEYTSAVWLDQSAQGGIDFDVSVGAGFHTKLLITQMLEYSRVSGDSGAYNWTNDATHGWSYSLTDGTGGDYFSVDVKKHPAVFGPIFAVRGGASSCPYEPWDTNGVATMAKRDNPRIFASPALRDNANPDKPAIFTVAIANESDEERTYILSLDNSSNLGGAIVMAGGVPINSGVPTNTGLDYTIGAGQTQNIVVSVQRGPSKYRYDNLRLVAKPSCSPSGDGVADTALISVNFTAPCSDVTLEEPSPGWKVNERDSTLAVTLGGYQINVSETDSVAEMWAEYRETAPILGAWTRAVGVDIVNLTALKDSARAYRTWRLKGLSDGTYELRAVTRCSGGTNYSAGVAGTIDRTPPVVTSYQPRNGVLSFGGTIGVTFSEAIDPASINTDSIQLVYASGLLDPISISSQVSGNSLTMSAPTLNENAIVTATVGGVRDLFGNPLPAPINWTFKVNRSSFHLSDNNLSLVRPWGAPGSITVTAANGTTNQGVMTIQKIPWWLTWTTPQNDTLGAQSSKTLTFTINASVKRDTLYSDTVVIGWNQYNDTLVVGLTAPCMPPAWTVNPSLYVNSMTVTAQVYFDTTSVPESDTGIIVAALVGNTIRGVAHLQQLGPGLNGGFAFLTVYSNSSGGEKVRFHIFDPGSCAIYNAVVPTMTFLPNDMEGTPANPVKLRGSILTLDASLSVPMNIGWTWFSYNLKPEDSAPGSILGNVTPSSGDMLKAQGSYCQYVSADSGDASWYGPLAELSYNNSYMVRLKSGGGIGLPGGTLRPDTVTMSLKKGWNWIGYLPSVDLAPAQAFSGIVGGTSSDGEMVMSQNQYVQYLHPYGWLGTLTMMHPGLGYRYYSTENRAFTYPPNPLVMPSALAGAMTTPRNDLAKDGRSSSLALAAGPGWSVDPSQYQNNMTITAIVDIDGITSVNDSDVVAAFVGDTCRGVASAVYISSQNRNEFFLMAFSNRPGGETMRFLYYDGKNRQTRDVTEQVQFAVDAILGTVSSPYALHAGAVLGVDGKPLLPQSYALWQNYPNPFNPATVIRYDLPEESKVTLKLYNALGQVVSTLADGIEPAGFKVKRFDGAGIATGVYFYRLEATSLTHPGKGLTQNMKMILIK